MNAAYASPNVSTLAAHWWMPVIRGVAAILFGVLCLTRPGSSLLALVILWGAYALVDGVFAVVHAVERGRAGASWGWLLFGGIVSIAAGVFTFAWPAITATLLLAIIAVWAIVTGIAEIVAAIRLRREIHGEWALVGSGVLSVAFGVLMFLYPGAGTLAVVWLIGAYAILFGMLLVAFGVRLNRWRRSGERMIPTGGAPTAA